MDRKMYKNIICIEDYYRYFPDKPWCYFDQVQEFKWYRKYDYEEWCDRFCVDLKMSDIEGKDTILIRLIHVSGDGTCNMIGWISGLEIVDLKYSKTGYEIQYEVLDYEDSSVHFYCNEIEVKVISVNGEEIEYE